MSKVKGRFGNISLHSSKLQNINVFTLINSVVSNPLYRSIFENKKGFELHCNKFISNKVFTIVNSEVLVNKVISEETVRYYF